MSFNSKVAKIFLLIFFLKFILLIIRFRSVIKWSILNYFIFLWWEVRVKVVFTRGYLVITASFVEKTMLFHWITFISLSKINWMYWMYMCIYIYAWIYLWILYCLIYVSVMPIPHYHDYWNFVICLETRVNSPTFVLFQNCFDSSGYFAFQYNF